MKVDRLKTAWDRIDERKDQQVGNSTPENDETIAEA